jgi:acyl-CoA hydrolase
MRSPRHSEVEVTELMIPAYSNFGGKVHGGIILSLMDKAAYACASKYSGSYCVTVSVEGVQFLSPVEVGDLVTIKAMVNYVGNTSMIVGMRVESLNVRTGISRHTNSSYFTMVAKTESGELLEVPSLRISNELELRRFCEGKMLKALSKEKNAMLKADFKSHTRNELLAMLVDERCEVELML